MASALATLMVRAGLLSEGQGRAAFEHAASSGRAVIEALLELGLADEDALVAFAQSRLLIPRVRDVVLGRVPATTWGLIPGELAWRTLAMPISLDDAGNLTIALADPTDAEAVDALAKHTRAYVIRAVAPLAALRAMMTARYGPREALDPAATQPGMIREAHARAIPGRGPTLAGTEALEHRGDSHPAAAIAMRASGWSAPETPIGMPAVTGPDPRAPARTPGGANYDPRKARLHHVSPEESAALSGAVRAVAPGALDQTERPMVNPYGVVQGYGAPFDRPQSPPRPHADPFATEPGSRGGTTGSSAPNVGASVTGAPHPAALHGAARPQSQPHIGSGPMSELPRGPRPPAATPGGGSYGLPDPRNMEAAGVEKRIVSVTPTRTPARTPGPRGHVWNPPLTGPAAEPVPLSPEAFHVVLPRIQAAASRDDVVRLVLDFFGAGFSRVILFVHSHQELRGHDCRGADLMVEAVRQVRIPTSGPSLFERCISSKAPYFGRMTTNTEIDSAFAQALGGVSGNVLLLPMTLGDRVPLVLFAHGTRHAVDPVSVYDLTTIVGGVLQRLLMQAKRG